MENFVQLQDITKIYKMGEIEIRAVDGIDLPFIKVNLLLLGAQRRRENDSAQYPGRNGYSDIGQSVCGREKRLLSTRRGN